MFKTLFIDRFTKFDKDEDLKMKKEEVIESMKDIGGLNSILANDTIIEIIINDIANRHGEDGD